MASKRLASLNVEVEKCSDVCPFFRENCCADYGTTYDCHANDHVDLEKHFHTGNYMRPRIVRPDFPKNCPLETVTINHPHTKDTPRELSPEKENKTTKSNKES